MRPIVAQICDASKSAAKDVDLFNELGMTQVLADLGDEATQPGLWFVLDDDTQAVIEPAMLFLLGTHGQPDIRELGDGEIPRTATNRQTAYELAEWLRFIGFAKRRWDKANHQLMAIYAHSLVTRPSRHTGRRRKRATIGHKLSTVYSFYTFMNATGACSVAWDPAAIRSRFKRGGRARRAEDDEVRPFSIDKMKRLLAAMGPLPTEIPAHSAATCRDRLLVEVARKTGMRGEEICHLSAAAIRRMKPNLAAPDATMPIRITVTKGKEFRWVAIPNSVLIELQRYISTERAEAMKELKSRGGRDHGFVFVNLAGARGSGGKLSTNTIHRRFRATMLLLGMSKSVSKVVDGEKKRVRIADHSFHDLRHTFAVNAYESFLDANRLSRHNPPYPEPWKTVASLLGHDDWHSTKTYLERAIGAREQVIGTRVNDYLEDRT